MADFVRFSLARTHSLRRLPLAVLLAFIGANTALLLAVRTATFQAWVSLPVASATGGLVSHVLLANALMAAVLVGGLAVAAGGLRLRDAGLVFGWRGLWLVLNATIVTFSVWALAQLIIAAAGALTPSDLYANPAWIGFLTTSRSALGESLSMLLGSALVEEVVYRGVLLPQLMIAIGAWTARAGLRLWAALAVSQAVFGLNHIPVGLDAGFAGATLALYVVSVAGVGLMFAVLYLRTGNLLIPVGMHALINEPMPMYLGGPDPRVVTLALVGGLIAAWPLLRRWFSHVFTPERLQAMARLHRRKRRRPPPPPS